ncbi:MAG: RsmB/NOP family class I SAM-dependent RNA methyltransferase [Sumerlaeia bacterium]
MHPRALVDITAELLQQFRRHTAPADRALQKFLKEKGFLGSHDRKFVSEAFYYTLRHVIRFDEALRQSFENAPYTEWISPSLGFPAGNPEGLACWQSPPVEEKRGPYGSAKVGLPLDQWVDSLRVALAADELAPDDPDQPPFFGFVEETFHRDWTLNESWHQGEWVVRLINRTRENVSRLKNQPKRNSPNSSEFQYSTPQWLYATLAYGLKQNENDDFFRSLLESAPVSLRVNTLKTSRDEYIQLLQEKAPQLDFQESELVPDGILFSRRVANGQLPGEREGLVEFQDEGSQLISTLVGIKPGALVLDVCAGGGGKSLHLAALMKNKGTILMHDKVPRRLTNGLARCAAAGATIARPLEPNYLADGLSGQPNLKTLYKKADLVLIDAPCSGLGTLRRSPEIKLRLSPIQLGKTIKTQQELLSYYAQAVRPGGVLAYVTCSLLREENEDATDRFLKANPEFHRRVFQEAELPDPSMLSRFGDLRLYPHRHNTDGFYLARLERKG